MDKKQYTTGIPMEQVEIEDDFGGRIQETVRTRLIPYQWEALNDHIEGAEPSYCLRNFRVAAGKEPGTFAGCVFQDSDVAKWIEAAAYTLISHPDSALEATVDEAVDQIVSAQQPDGYLDTYYIIHGLEQRWTNLRDNHELYCAGHMLEAAIAYYRATGKRKLLDAMLRYVDLIDSTFGAEEGKIHGYPGHEIIEMALMKLYELTGEEKHRRLAKYFIDQRGQEPLYFAQEMSEKPFRWGNTSYEYQYYQAGMPVREQKEAQGHAVRAVYLYSGMADVARSTEDEGLWRALEGLWNNMTKRRMYITGAIGSSHVGEAFTYDYDLPNDTVYGETCASVGLAFLAKRMLSIEPEGTYADVLERALYNGVISGMNLAGDRFFYVNPLGVLPEASLKDEGKRHVKPSRQKWFHCACCPPNLARLLSSLGDYIYGIREKTLFIHLYVGSRVEADLQGQKVCLQVQTRYPWEEEVRIRVETCEEGDWTLALRIPGWCRQYTLTCGGKPVEGVEKAGYLYVTRAWKPEEEILLTLAMPVEKVEANPRVREDIGKAAIMRGPLVYCLEEADNGKDLHRIRLTEKTDWEIRYEPELLNGVVTISAMGEMRSQEDWEEDALYRPFGEDRYELKKLKWIPYYAWANREEGEMLVWIRNLA